MIGTLLLYILVRDTRELGDEELRELLEIMLGVAGAQCGELKQTLEALLEAEELDREAIKELPLEFVELLPEQMKDYDQALYSFHLILEEMLEKEELEENHRVERFRYCLELLHDDEGWESSSEAARGIGTLEEELYSHRDAYEEKPLKLEECNSYSVIGHLNLQEGFETWREAFRLAHGGELEDALEAAVEATGLFAAVEEWAQQA
ncbi:MAG TPA: hypothetical protein EYO33_05615 [Phycisphaerales bacterium]|nr:hypothetical protein [Phycisphaerales bacterium]